MPLPEIKVPKVPERPNPKQFRLNPTAYVECVFCEYMITDKNSTRPRRVRAAVRKRFYRQHLRNVHRLVPNVE